MVKRPRLRLVLKLPGGKQVQHAETAGVLWRILLLLPTTHSPGAAEDRLCGLIHQHRAILVALKIAAASAGGQAFMQNLQALERYRRQRGSRDTALRA